MLGGMGLEFGPHAVDVLSHAMLVDLTVKREREGAELFRVEFLLLEPIQCFGQ
mgnify:CR=1 FL=1